MFPLRATIIEDSWMTQFANFLESAIPQHSLGFSVSAMPRTNTTQITHASMTGSLNKYISLSSFATSVQMLKHTLAAEQLARLLPTSVNLLASRTQ